MYMIKSATPTHDIILIFENEYLVMIGSGILVDAGIVYRYSSQISSGSDTARQEYSWCHCCNRVFKNSGDVERYHMCIVYISRKNKVKLFVDFRKNQV